MPPLNPFQDPGQLPPALPGVPGLPQSSVLQAQIGDIMRQIQQLDVQREVSAERLHDATGVQAQRIQAEIARIDANVASLSARRDEIISRIVQSEVQQHILVPPRLPDAPLIDPDAVTAVFVMFSIGIILPLSIGLMRRVWRRTPKQALPARDADPMAAPRLERLEQAVDAIAIEIERISEGQRFITKVLTERGVPARQPAASDVNASAGIGEAKPFLALGAGPIEPIRAAERQAVRPSITPH